MKARSDNRSGIPNVHYEVDRDKWCAEIRVKVKGRIVRRRRRFPGSPDGMEEAARWAREERERLVG